MIKDDLHIFKNITTLCHGFTEFLRSTITEKGQEFSIALSGGTTPKVVFDYWSNEPKNSILWKNIKLFWGDERCVPPNDPMSNYKMTKEHLLNNIDIPSENIFRIQGEDNPIEEAIRYSEVLNTSVRTANNIPEIDIIMLGLGDDGHTVSIFPHEIELWNNDSNCIVARHPESGMRRVSITGKVINNAKHVVFLATGKNKAEKVRDIIKERSKFLDLYPAAKVSPKNHHIHWFLDEDAASLIR